MTLLLSITCLLLKLTEKCWLTNISNCSTGSLKVSSFSRPLTFTHSFRCISLSVLAYASKLWCKEEMKRIFLFLSLTNSANCWIKYNSLSGSCLAAYSRNFPNSSITITSNPSFSPTFSYC
ncbi:hypothetical protein ES705_25476 [subsurface metagenome]